MTAIILAVLALAFVASWLNEGGVLTLITGLLVIVALGYALAEAMS